MENQQDYTLLIKRLEKSIEEISQKSGSIEDDLTKAQKDIDIIAKRYPYESIGKPFYKLLHLQACIHWLNNNMDEAKEYAQYAEKIFGEPFSKNTDLLNNITHDHTNDKAGGRVKRTVAYILLLLGVLGLAGGIMSMVSGSSGSSDNIGSIIFSIIIAAIGYAMMRL